METEAKEYLRHAIIEVTPVCNLHCRHCYNPWKRKGANDAEGGSYRKAAALLGWLIARTTAERVVFTGGEPTISERFLELVVHAKVNGLRVSVITNGNGGWDI